MPHFLIFYEKAIDKRTFSLLYCPLSCRAEYGGIAQLARAFGSYPKCPRFESRCRYQRARDARASRALYGPLVKWLRHGPFTAVTWVRVPYGSPLRQSVKRDCRINGGLAQLVRAPASHAGGHWFESSSLHQTEGTTESRAFCFFQPTNRAIRRSFPCVWINI